MAVQGDEADRMWRDLGTSQLHGDLIIQILVNLPIISILRFKSVCRAWYALFNSPTFIKQHCRISSASSKINNLLSLLVHPPRRNRIVDVYFEVVEYSSGKQPVRKILDFPFEGNFNKVVVVGSINGLVCLNLCVNATLIVLWNPAMRKYFEIPSPLLLKQSADEKAGIGFAFDPETDCYKVVRIVYLSKMATLDLMVARVEIYSTGTNTWRITGAVELPSYTSLCNGIMVGGAPYWLASLSTATSTFPPFIVWFDASSETFRFHPLPYDNHDRRYPRLEVMGDHPVLMYCKYARRQSTDALYTPRVDIWKLNKCESSEKDSFDVEKLLTVECECDPILGDIVGLWRNGEILAMDPNTSLLLYDQEESKYLANYESLARYCVPRVYYHTDSLVWPCRLA